MRSFWKGVCSGLREIRILQNSRLLLLYETALFNFKACAAVAGEILWSLWEGLKSEGEQPTLEFERRAHKPRATSADLLNTTVLPTLITLLESKLLYHFSSVLILIFLLGFLAKHLQRLRKLSLDKSL